nr:MAG TPA: hypothetical protein [Caudoviricetes sp.]
MITKLIRFSVLLVFLLDISTVLLSLLIMQL